MQVDQPVDLKYMAPIPYGAAPDWMTAGDAAHLTAAQIEGLKMPQSTAEWEHAMTTASEYLIEAGGGEFAKGDEAFAKGTAGDGFMVYLGRRRACSRAT